MIPRKYLSYAKNKNIGKGDILNLELIYHILVYVITFLCISIAFITIPCRDKKTPLLDMEEEFDIYSRMREKVVFSPSHFSFDYKTVVH